MAIQHVLTGTVGGAIDDNNTVPVLGVRIPGTEGAIMGAQLFASGAAGATVIQLVLDSVVIAGESPSTRGNLPVSARLTAYEPLANELLSLGIVLPGDGQSDAMNLLAVSSWPLLFNGATYDQARELSAANLSATISGSGGAIAASPGEWVVNSEPAVSTQATATRAAGAAGVRHVCKSLHFSLAAVVAQTIIYARVRDGASGAGAILWSQGIIVPAGENVHIELSDLNIVGSAATAMTFEWSAAPVATNFQTAGGSGYSAN